MIYTLRQPQKVATRAAKNLGAYGVALRGAVATVAVDSSIRMILACSALASGDQVPPRPEVTLARSSGDDPLSFLR